MAEHLRWRAARCRHSGNTEVATCLIRDLIAAEVEQAVHARLAA